MLAAVHRLVIVVLLLVATVPARAQIVDVPPFLALDGTGAEHFGNFRMATGGDSSVLVVTNRWTRDVAKEQSIAQHFSAAGVKTGAMLFLAPDLVTYLPAPFPDSRGGFITLWTHSYGSRIGGRLLSQGGLPTTEPFLATNAFGYNPGAAGASYGFAVVWGDANGIRVGRFDAAGSSLDAVPALVPVDPSTRGYPLTARLSDGGFVVAWHEGVPVRAHRFDAAGAPTGGIIDVTDEFTMWDLVASPLGGFAVVGARTEPTHARPGGVWARRFDANGNALGPAFVVEVMENPLFFVPRGAYDAFGRLFVAWQTAFAVDAPLGRAYDVNGRALRTPFELADERMSALELAARPDGRIVEAWREGNYSLRMQVQSLCAPPFHTACGDGVATAPCERCDAGPANSDTTPDACRTTCDLPSCGDGVVDRFETCDDGNRVGCDGCDADCNVEPGWQCGDGVVSTDCDEQCDDGAGNDDVTPNACRTDCRRAHCGDGVLDDGEGCDDGNRASCDGCSDLCVPEPGLVCGDGIAEVRCGEQCDDANDVVGDGCAAGCRLERIPGGGAPVTDCQIEWVVDNPSNAPLVDKTGAISAVQVCRDGDAACDFDDVAGTCTFHVRVCGNNTDVPGCTPGTRLRSWELRTPSAKKAATRPALAAVREAFAGVPGAIVGPAFPDVCSDVLAVPVDLKRSGSAPKAGTLVLKSQSTLYDGERDADRLKLVCFP